MIKLIHSDKHLSEYLQLSLKDKDVNVLGNLNKDYNKDNNSIGFPNSTNNKEEDEDEIITIPTNKKYEKYDNKNNINNNNFNIKYTDKIEKPEIIIENTDEFYKTGLSMNFTKKTAKKNEIGNIVDTETERKITNNKSYVILPNINLDKNSNIEDVTQSKKSSIDF